MKRKEKSRTTKAAAKPGKKSAKAPPKKAIVKAAKKKVSAKKTSAKTSKPASKAKPESKKKPVAKSKTAAKAKSVAKKPAAAKPAARASRTLRPKVFEQSPAVREFGFPAEVPEIPQNYGRDRLVLMTQDPDYLFSYWEVTPRQLAAKESEKREDQAYREALKLNWAARSLFEENFVLLPVSLDARRWYLRVPFPGLSYHVEIGWLGDQGHFISILESNESESPESWDATRSRLQAAGEVLAYSSRVSKPSGSSRMTTIDETIFTTLKDWNPNSLSSSPGAKKKKPKSSGR